MNENYLILFERMLHHFYNFRLLTVVPKKISFIREMISKLSFLNLFSHFNLTFKINYKFYQLINQYNLKLTTKLFFTITKSNKVFIINYCTTNYKNYMDVFENYSKVVNNKIKQIKNKTPIDQSLNCHLLVNYQYFINFIDCYDIIKYFCYEKKYFQQHNDQHQNSDLSHCYCMDRRMFENNVGIDDDDECDGMACCDECNQWNHMNCLGIKTKKQRNELKLLANFYCPICSEERQSEYPFIWPVKRPKKNKNIRPNDEKDIDGIQKGHSNEEDGNEEDQKPNKLNGIISSHDLSVVTDDQICEKQKKSRKRIKVEEKSSNEIKVVNVVDQIIVDNLFDQKEINEGSEEFTLC